MTYADIPISIKNFDRSQLLIGTKINVEFVTDTHEENTSESLETKAAGVKVMQKENITTTNSYLIENAVVANLLTSTGEPIYDIYVSLSAIPEINQESYLKTAVKENKEYMTSIAPAKARIIIDEEYAEAISNTVRNNTAVSMDITEESDTDSDEKAEFYRNEQLLMESISKILG